MLLKNRPRANYGSSWAWLQASWLLVRQIATLIATTLIKRIYSPVMELKIYTVYDAKAEAYLAPSFVSNDQVAARAFEYAVNSDEHDFGRFPEDYTMFRIGIFDPMTGAITSETPGTCIAKAIELRRTE